MGNFVFINIQRVTAFAHLKNSGSFPRSQKLSLKKINTPQTRAEMSINLIVQFLTKTKISFYNQ